MTKFRILLLPSSEPLRIGDLDPGTSFTLRGGNGKFNRDNIGNILEGEDEHSKVEISYMIEGIAHTYNSRCDSDLEVIPVYYCSNCGQYISYDECEEIDDRAICPACEDYEDALIAEREEKEAADWEETKRSLNITER